MQNYYDLNEAASYTGIEKRFIVRLVQRGVIEGIQIADGEYRFSEATLMAMDFCGLSKRKVGTTN